MKLLTTFLLPTVALAAIPGFCSVGWEWIPLPGTKCMSGQESGVRVRRSRHGNKNLGIFLNGGGACFNGFTCGFTGNPLQDRITPTATMCGSAGVFSSRSENPLADYNWISVPYCTQDIFGGEFAGIFEGKLRHFHGAQNLRLTMEYAIENFKNVDTLFIMGISAGGFGSITMYSLMRDYFPNARGVLLDDSGPVLDNEAMSVCLQEDWRHAWQLNKNLPEGCPCNNDHGGDFVGIWDYVQERYPKDSFGLVSSIQDSAIAMFFSFGIVNCSHTVPLPFWYHGLHDGLIRLANTTRTPVYMIPGEQHTHTIANDFFARQVDGVHLYKWVAQLISANDSDPSTVQPNETDYYLERSGLSSVHLMEEGMSGKFQHVLDCFRGGTALDMDSESKQILDCFRKGTAVGIGNANMTKISVGVLTSIKDRCTWTDFVVVHVFIAIAFSVWTRVGRSSDRSQFVALLQ